MQFSITFSLVLSSLFLFANSQSTYPGCVNAACGPFKSVALSNCGYDISASSDATVTQTECICTLSNFQAILQPCVKCLSLSSDPSVAKSFESICSNSTSSSASPSGSSTTSANSSSTKSSSSTSGSTTTSSPSSSTTTTGTTTTGTTTTTSDTTTSDTTTTTSTGSQTTLSSHTSTSTSTGAGYTMAPGVGLAVMLVVAQAGF